MRATTPMLLAAVVALPAFAKGSATKPPQANKDPDFIDSPQRKDPDFELRADAVAGHNPCGDVRVAVKTMTDTAAHAVAMKPTNTTVAKLTALHAPPFQEQGPRSTAEKHTYTLTAMLLGFLQEDDQDFHLVLQDLGDKNITMVAEIPAPDCVAASSVKARVDAARTKFGQTFGVTQGYKALPVPVQVTLTGVLFFDKLHGQQGVAKNGVELHPVLDFCNGPGCAAPHPAPPPPKPAKKAKAQQHAAADR